MFARLFAALFGTRTGRTATVEAPQVQSRETRPAPSFLRREALLDRRQQVAAYIFSVERPQRHWSAASEKFFDASLIAQFRDGRMQPVLGKRLAFLPLGPGGWSTRTCPDCPGKTWSSSSRPPPTRFWTGRRCWPA